MRRVPLKRLASVVAGQSPPSNEVHDFEGEGLPFLQGNAEFGWQYPQPVHRCDSASKKIAAGNILVSVRAPVGALNIADRSYGIGRGLAAVQASEELNRRYCWWWLHSAVPHLRSKVTGSTYEAIRSEEIGALQVPMKSPAVQQAISDFLDAETARIDALIAKKQRLLALNEARRWTAFNVRIEASNPDLVPLRRAIHTISDGPFGSAFSSQDYSDDGAVVVRLGNIGFAEFRNDDVARIPLDLYGTFLRHRARAGDLLIAGLGDDRNHAGRACVAPDLGPAMVKGKSFCAQVNTRVADPSFLAFYLSSPQGAQRTSLAARGSTRSMINLDLVKSVEVPLPSLDDQRNIARATEDERRRSRIAAKLLNRQIFLLRERRQALITAAVNGEIDIPGVAA